MGGDMKKEILSAYVKVYAALAADDLASAKTAATAAAGNAGMSDSYKAIEPKAAAVAKASSVETARGAFKELSAAVEPLATGQKDYVVMYCPMADSD